jgi:subtilisin-like proprotein convertase family protein
MKASLRGRIYRASAHLSVFEKIKKFYMKKSGSLFALFVVCCAATSSLGATFPADAPSLGAIPDSDVGSPVCQNNSTTFKDVTFTVSGIAGPALVTAVSFSASHTFLQDLEVSLRAPGGSPSHLLFAATGTTATAANSCAGSANDLSTANTYTFSDSAASNWWTTAATNPVPTSSSRTVVTGIGGTTNPPATTNMTNTFLSVFSPNGTWTLRFRDRGAGDTGTVTAATLSLQSGDPPFDHALDFNGDGKTDLVVLRNTGGGPSGQLTWFTLYNGVAGGSTDPWGIASDIVTPGDYDGDGRTDVSIWRPGAPGAAAWYTLLSSTHTLRAENFGQTGDLADVQGDYDNDGKDDIAVYRPPNAPSGPAVWYYRTAQNGPVFAVAWGQQGDFSAPGDYDGDGKNDFVIQRNAGGGQARFWILFANGSSTSLVFGTPTDVIVPGDYDGDGKTDIAVLRDAGGQLQWWIHPSIGGADVAAAWGTTATDFAAQGDYDGDGKTDMAVWRPSPAPGLSAFYINRSSGGVMIPTWGQNGDYPVANFNTH